MISIIATISGEMLSKHWLAPTYVLQQIQVWPKKTYVLSPSPSFYIKAGSMELLAGNGTITTINSLTKTLSRILMLTFIYHDVVYEECFLGWCLMDCYLLP